jgi:hypothetical protein
MLPDIFEGSFMLLIEIISFDNENPERGGAFKRAFKPFGWSNLEM